MFCPQYHPNVSLNVPYCTHAHDFTFSSLHMGMIFPSMSGSYFWLGYSGRQRPICTPDSCRSPRSPQETGLWQGNACQAGPGVVSSRDVVCTSPRMGGASWALLRGIQDCDQKNDLKQEKESLSEGITRSELTAMHGMLPGDLGWQGGEVTNGPEAFEASLGEAIQIIPFLEETFQARGNELHTHFHIYI